MKGIVIPATGEAVRTAWLLLAAICCSAGAAQGQTIAPQVVRPQAQSVRALLEQQRQVGPEFYPVEQADGSFRAYNPAEGFLVSFEASGVRLSPGGAPDLLLRHEAQGTATLSEEIIRYDTPGARAWYHNGALGLQQGFVIGEKSATGSSEAVVSLGIEGPYVARLDDAGCVVLEGDRADLSYCTLHAWDADGTALPAHFEVDEKGPAVTLHVDARGARYPVYIDPVLSVSQKVAPDGLITDGYFGQWVAIDGDVAIISAYGEGHGMLQPGAAYIYRKIEGRWVEEATLRSDEPAPGDWFGTRVSVSGDTAVVGMSARCRGAVFVFRHTEAGWVQEARLTSDLDGVCLGNSGLSIRGERIVAGSWGGNKALVFDRLDGHWTLTGLLSPSVQNTSFAGSISIQRDRVAVGGSDTLPGGDSRGRVFMFRQTEAGWVEETVLMAAEGVPAGDHFGGSVAFTSPGRLVVGSSERGGLGLEAGNGKTYVFEYQAEGWQRTAILEASDGGRWLGFGGAVGEGNTIVVSSGAVRDRTATVAYVFREIDGVWRETYKLVPEGDPIGLGSGTVGYSDGVVLLGASTDDVGRRDTGSAFFFDLEDYDTDRVANDEDNCPLLANGEQADGDADGVGDLCDGCPQDGAKAEPGQCGCGQTDADSDGDGVVDCADPCPEVAGACGCGVADADSDGDGVLDCADGCALDAEKTAPGECGCGVADTDSDSDGTADCLDACPNDRRKTVAGRCGCGVSDADLDGDDAPDCLDACPEDRRKVAPGQCGCGVADVDTDADGALDCDDACPEDAEKIAPGQCGCGVADDDTDADGTPDCEDGCAEDVGKTDPGTCGCGIADDDTDADGTADCFDGCPQDAGKTAPGTCGCGTADTDRDGDGVPDCRDGCADDPEGVAPGVCGCGVPETDSDGDGTLDCLDGCAADASKTAPGACGCGSPETDTDGDGTPDCTDLCPQDGAKTAPERCGCGAADDDADADGVADCVDGCPDDATKAEPGVCGCGVADDDTDGDGAVDCLDGCPADGNKAQPGVCGCGTPDVDSDGDGAADCEDRCPEDPTKTVPERCGCGVPEGECVRGRIDAGPARPADSTPEPGQQLVDRPSAESGCDIGASMGSKGGPAPTAPALLLAVLLGVRRRRRG